MTSGVGEMNQKVIAEFRESGGQLTGNYAEAPVLLLTTKGARSGRLVTSPMLYLRDGGRLVVFAAKAGAPVNPAWYHNLRANPDVTVEVGTRRYPARATEVHGDERAALYERQVEAFPRFADYEKATSRTIPVIVLTPVE